MLEAGWRRRTDRSYTRDVNSDVIGTLGLGWVAGRSDAWLEFSPTLAVRHQPLERNVAELLNERFHPYTPGTVGTSLGYLTPQDRYLTWKFTPSTDVDATVRDLVRSLAQYGLPFLDRNSTMEAIVGTMGLPRFRVNMHHCYRLPVAYALLGNREAALAELERFRAMPVEKRQIAADRYSEFAIAFRRRFGFE